MTSLRRRRGIHRFFVLLRTIVAYGRAGFKQTRSSGAVARGTHPSKIAKGGAASVVVVRANPPEPES
jgi:hypothetical protein